MNGYYWRLKVGHKYDPSQPRVPAGDPRGGQWTESGQAVDEEYAPITVEANVPDEEIVGTLGPRWRAFDGEAWRGPNRYRGDDGPKHLNVYGDGTYYAMDEEGARTWTDEPRKQQVQLENPLYLDSREKDEAFRSFVERDTGIEIGYPWNTRLGERAMTRWLEDNWYDGIVVDYPGAPGGAQVIKVGR
jgi:hypothetical protein